ncbi:MAG: hypothetical protein MUF87_13065 [Anaerolineae bacterium]|jgi:hypothetical protein|nr:hypothetical protein [Anaerolineae bacterium]
MTDQPNQPLNEEAPRTPFEEFLYHQRRALEETGKALEALLPEGFRVHSAEATKEFSKGFRVLIDAAVDEIKKASERVEVNVKVNSDDDDTSTTGKTKVKVQVD